MRVLPIFLLAGMVFSAEAQSGSATASSATQVTGQAGAQTSQASAETVQATQVNAELTKKLDSKNAKVGDEVLAKTTSKARLADGTTLPKGTKLTGKVTAAQAKTGAEHASRLAFAFDHAVLHDGSQIPVHVALMSIAAPASAATQDDAMIGGPIGAGAGGSGRSSGGLSGAPAGGLAQPVGSTVSNTVHGVGETAGGAGEAVDGAVNETAGAAPSVHTSASGGVVTGAVANLPGVTFSSAVQGSGEAVLEASGKNIELSSGTQLMLGIAASH
jgi:hypothetical protein